MNEIKPSGGGKKEVRFEKARWRGRLEHCKRREGTSLPRKGSEPNVKEQWLRRGRGEEEAFDCVPGEKEGRRRSRGGDFGRNDLAVH